MTTFATTSRHDRGGDGALISTPIDLYPYVNFGRLTLLPTPIDSPAKSSPIAVGHVHFD